LGVYPEPLGSTLGGAGGGGGGGGISFLDFSTEGLDVFELVEMTEAAEDLVDLLGRLNPGYEDGIAIRARVEDHDSLTRQKQIRS
jgi:hypothetical protein